MLHCIWVSRPTSTIEALEENEFELNNGDGVKTRQCGGPGDTSTYLYAVWDSRAGTSDSSGLRAPRALGCLRRYCIGRRPDLLQKVPSFPDCFFSFLGRSPATPGPGEPLLVSILAEHQRRGIHGTSISTCLVANHARQDRTNIEG